MIKKSQSEVVTSVLLILIVIAAASIIIGFVIPFVRNQISDSDCFKVIDQIKITENTDYNCYENNNMSLQIHMGDAVDLINGFIIEVGGASTKAFEVTNGTDGSSNKIYMYGGSSTIILPKKNEEKTYILADLDAKPEIIRLYPILNSGKTCSSPSSVLNSIETCL